MDRFNTLLSLLFLTTAATAQDATPRPSSSMYLPAWPKADVSLTFNMEAEGKRYNPTWGLDMAWINEQNLKKGINHMGKENVGIGRVAYRFTDALVGDSALTAAVASVLRQRAGFFNQISPTLPLTLTADQDAGTNEYYVKNKVTDVSHWAAMINSHVHWLQQYTKHPVAGVSPFNEGDYWTEEEGASPARQWQVAKLLKEQYPRCADVAMVGGNTLNDDKALAWYTPGKQYYDWGNTHQLAGSFDNFAGFFQQLARDGKVGYADEMHNVGEAMVGLEYGMTVGIWWGFDSRARGEFCQFSRHGSRIGYGEHRQNWTAASVYRHDDGRVKAFIGSSERQAVTTSFQFVANGRDVYYDGYGPVREYYSVMPGGNGYQKGQTNAERVVDVTWGEDVAPGVIDGTYKLVNKMSGNVVAYTASGSNIVQQREQAANLRQQWTVRPATNRSGGDLSFLDIEAADNAKIRMNVKNYSLASGADLIAWTQDGPTSNEQWYAEYAGNGYYYLRNRESALYMAASSSAPTARLIQTTMLTEAQRDRMMFRLLPVGTAYETVAPAAPTGLTAEAHAAAVTLNWTASADDDTEGYMVLRTAQGTDDWNTIARKLTTTTYTDNTCLQGVSYIYKVKAIDRAQNLSVASDTVAATPTGAPALVAAWPMEGTLYDTTANMMDAAYGGTPAYTADSKQGSQALRLVATQGKYVQLPYEVASSDELTVAMWVKVRSSSQWQRLFDFGNDTEHYMFLTPLNGYTNVMRFAIKNGGDEQTLDCKTRLTTQQWKHVAVTIGQGRTTIYVDGQEAASTTAITIRPSDLRPTLNYLGRSQFAADPLLTADLDDVRIYNYAVAATDVQAIMGGDSPSGLTDAPRQDSQPAGVYDLRGVRHGEMQRGLNIVRGKKVLR